MKKLNNMDLIVEMGNVNNKKRNYGIANTNKSKKRSVDINKRNEIVEMSNNKIKKRNHDTVNINKSKKRSANNNNKRDENKKFTLEYFVGKCVEVAATKGFKIRGTKMLAVGMFEINGETYLLTVNEYGVLFWVVDLGTLVIAVTRYLSKSQDDNYDLNCHCISTLEAWKILEGFY